MENEHAIIEIVVGMLIVGMVLGGMIVYIYLTSQGEVFTCSESTVSVRNGVTVYTDCEIFSDADAGRHVEVTVTLPEVLR